MTKRKKKRKIHLLIITLVFIVIILFVLDYFNVIPKPHYTASDFRIDTVKSAVDFNGNGTDDYTDILLGARMEADARPVYDPKYWDEGYPPDGIGVCTDVVWRAFKNAGYNLRRMMDNDIAAHLDLYPAIEHPDSNIDFRRVVNQHVFFKRYAVALTTDLQEIDQWQPGDIVIFAGDEHIGIISDKRTKEGRPYLIHNGGLQVHYEEDVLERKEIIGHYRFDASLINQSILIPFE